MLRARKVFPLLPILVLSAPAAAQGQGYSLGPGDVVIADTSSPIQGRPGAVRILHPDRSLEDVIVGPPIYHASDVVVDRDGAILVSNWQDVGSLENGIYRIDPSTGAVTRLNGEALKDNFSFVRDGRGDLVVADGSAGLARIEAGGQVTWFSPTVVLGDEDIGILLDYDGRFLVAEAPQPVVGNPNAGRVQWVDAGGLRQTLIEDPVRLQRPNGLALDRDGTFLVTNADFYPLAPVLQGLVRLDRTGLATSLHQGAPLYYPKDVEVAGPGLYAISDPGVEAVLVRKPSGAVATLVSELDDGDPTNGLPVDRPFGIAVVPRLWMITPLSVAPGQVATVEVRGPAFTPVVLAASRFPGPTPMNLFWPGDPQTSHVNLLQAGVFRGRTGSGGSEIFTIRVPAGLPPGSVLHLQAFLPGGRELSNYAALPVR